MTDTALALLPAPRAEAGSPVSPPLRTGPLDDLNATDLMPLLIAHGKAIGYSDSRRRDLVLGVRGILDWLSSYPGDGWQQRWTAADTGSLD
jgi:hypothetical protein